LAVIHDVVATAHLGDAVDRKASELIKAHTPVQNEHRKYHAVDDGSGEQVLRPVGHQPTEKIVFKLPVRLPYRLLEFNPFAFDLKQGAGLLLLHGLAQVVFQCADLRQQMADFFVHDGSFEHLSTQKPTRYKTPWRW